MTLTVYCQIPYFERQFLVEVPAAFDPDGEHVVISLFERKRGRNSCKFVIVGDDLAFNPHPISSTITLALKSRLSAPETLARRFCTAAANHWVSRSRQNRSNP